MHNEGVFYEVDVSGFVGHQPVVAVVYDPYMDRLYWAAKGLGAYENDRKLDLSSHKPTGKLGVCLEVAGAKRLRAFRLYYFAAIDYASFLSKCRRVRTIARSPCPPFCITSS